MMKRVTIQLGEVLNQTNFPAEAFAWQGFHDVRYKALDLCSSPTTSPFPLPTLPVSSKGIFCIQNLI